MKNWSILYFVMTLAYSFLLGAFAAITYHCNLIVPEIKWVITLFFWIGFIMLFYQSIYQKIKLNKKWKELE